MNNKQYNQILEASQEDFEEERFHFNYDHCNDNERDYNENIMKYKNVVIDTDNLNLSSNITFPWIRIIETECNQKTNIHFVSKRRSHIYSIVMDYIKAYFNINDYRYRHKKEGIYYTDVFIGLSNKIKNFNFYFHTIDHVNDYFFDKECFNDFGRNADDLYILYLYHQLYRINNDTIIVSDDRKMIYDHVLIPKDKQIFDCNYDETDRSYGKRLHYSSYPQFHVYVCCLDLSLATNYIKTMQYIRGLYRHNIVEYILGFCHLQYVNFQKSFAELELEQFYTIHKDTYRKGIADYFMVMPKYYGFC